ncbi:lipoyl synthase [Hydrogenimonas sp.]
MENHRYKKPEWLRKKIALSQLESMRLILAKGKMHTICEEALCPNMGECFSNNQATFLILGNICTRACTFCNVGAGTPMAPDPKEPQNLVDTVETLGLRHVVITSPTRDDLADGGAEHYCRVVQAIKDHDSGIRVELLIPDFHNKEKELEKIAFSGAEIIGHNLETVPRLYRIRKGANYERSLNVLKRLHRLNPNIHTKSGIMLGLGERDDEVLQLMKELVDVGCRLLSIGQYLSPSSAHTPVIEYVHPDKYEYFRKKGLEMGFDFIKSSPYTRSSYMAHEYLQEEG